MVERRRSGARGSARLRAGRVAPDAAALERATPAGVGLVPHLGQRRGEPLPREALSRGRQAARPRRRCGGADHRRAVRRQRGSGAGDAARVRAGHAAVDRCRARRGKGNAMRQAPMIVYVVFRFGVGGLENGIVNLVNRMPASRWRHAIVALTEISGEFAERIQRHDVRYVELDKRPGHLVRDYPRLYRMFRDLKPAVVHTRNLAALEAVVPAWAAGVPVRIHGEHGWNVNDPDGRRRSYQVVRRLYRPFVSRYV